MLNAALCMCWHLLVDIVWFEHGWFYMCQVQVQLKRLAHLLNEKNSTVPFSQHVKSNGSKKANKKPNTKPNVDQPLPAAQPKAKGKVHKGKKASNGQSKSSLAQAAPKIAKNKDKYKKKGNKDKKKGKPVAQN